MRCRVRTLQSLPRRLAPRTRKRRENRRGSMLITVLFFLLIGSVLLMGIGSYVAGHLTRATADANYARAIDLAEAGINYEFNKLGTNPANADQYPGATVNFGGGTFTVYCQNRDGSRPWDTTSGFLDVIATGAVGGVQRTVKASAKGFAPPGQYAIYTMDSISIWRGSSMSITGDVGSNGNLDFTAHPGITGSVYFDGPNAGWYGGTPSGYNVIREPAPIQWPTVNQVAQRINPGGLSFLAQFNNNGSANPPIVGNSITDNVTLVGPGNYYVTNINLTGSKTITFDNRNGPVNIWIGPEGGNGTARFRGGTGAVSVTSNPALANHIYVATRSGLDMAGNQTVDALVYAYNKDASGNEYGYVSNSGNPTVNGQIIANKVDINGNISINYSADLIRPSSFGYYGFDNSWTEINALQR